MTILYICDEYPPGKSGGIGTAVQVLSRELVKQGHRVIVVGLYSYDYGQLDYENDNGVEVYRLRYGLKLSKNPYSKRNRMQNRLPRFLQRILYGKRNIKKYTKFLNELIKQNNIDIIEIPDWSGFNHYIGFQFEWPRLNIPMVVKSHGCYTKLQYDMNNTIDGYYFKIDKLLYERADSIVAVSKDTAKFIKKIFSIKEEITVLYNGIETEEIYPVTDIDKREIATVVFSGSLIPLKGIHSLIKAWNIVSKKIPTAKLLIFGKGEVDFLLQLLDNSEKKNIFFKGHVNRRVLLRELSVATLAVYPSYSETFGLVAVEAMGMGCPVIYTQRSCGPEIIRENIDGMLIDPDNIEDIAEKIILLIQDKKLREKFSKQGRKRVEECFDISMSAANHVEYYKTLKIKKNDN